jgi:predicted transcriptional regulator
MTIWEDYGFIIASRYRTKITFLLLEGPKTPKELALATGFYLSHVSSTLSSLGKKEIVECLTPRLKRGKLFALTEKGKKAVSKLREARTDKPKSPTNRSVHTRIK